MKNKEFFDKLSAPFLTPDGKPDVKYRVLKGSTVVPYITVQQIIKRLNEVAGYSGWEDNTQEIASGEKAMLCTLTIRPPEGAEISHDGIGAPSNTHSFKGMHSDALKRAALKFGIGMHEKELPNLTLNMVQGKPATEDGRKLLTAEEISGYINHGTPYRIHLTNLYRSLSEKKQKELSNDFTALWSKIVS